jgi:hypothetical protein
MSNVIQFPVKLALTIRDLSIIRSALYLDDSPGFEWSAEDRARAGELADILDDSIVIGAEHDLERMQAWRGALDLPFAVPKKRDGSA